MGTTPVFGFPYPDPSDLVANYPALGQQLAEDVEAEFLLRGKILQVVRATDATQRSTTSATFVDVTGMTVTITPQKSTSAILLFATFTAQAGTTGTARFQITDNSNTAISGAQDTYMGLTSTINTGLVLWGYATPATTSATTYKTRFASSGGTVVLYNQLQTGQMYAIEVSA